MARSPWNHQKYAKSLTDAQRVNSAVDYVGNYDPVWEPVFDFRAQAEQAMMHQHYIDSQLGVHSNLRSAWEQDAANEWSKGLPDCRKRSWDP